MNKIISTIAIAGAGVIFGFLGQINSAHAVACSDSGAPTPCGVARITADNHYHFFIGQANGADLSLQFSSNNPSDSGPHDWTTPETGLFTWDSNGGSHIYLAAWNNPDRSPAMVIGQFTGPATGDVFTNDDDWEYIDTDLSPSASTGDIQALIAAATEWSDIPWEATNGPWGSNTSRGFDSQAKYIWGTEDGASFSQPTAGDYFIFRTKATIGVSQVPEPGSLALLGIGLAGLGALRRRRKIT